MCASKRTACACREVAAFFADVPWNSPNAWNLKLSFPYLFVNENPLTYLLMKIPLLICYWKSPYLFVTENPLTYLFGVILRSSWRGSIRRSTSRITKEQKAFAKFDQKALAKSYHHENRLKNWTFEASVVKPRIKRGWGWSYLKKRKLNKST